MNQLKTNTHSPYRRGADFGVYFGLYLTALFFASAFSISAPLLSFLSLVLIAGVPFVIYFMLRTSYRKDYCKTLFSSLWMEGIAIFFFGGLIASFVSVVYMRWINPDFINTQVDTLIDLYRSIDWDRGHEMADIFQRAREQHLLPSAIQITVDMLWLIVFSGSILSMLMALLVQAANKSTQKPI